MGILLDAVRELQAVVTLQTMIISGLNNRMSVLEDALGTEIMAAEDDVIEPSIPDEAREGVDSSTAAADKGSD